MVKISRPLGLTWTSHWRRWKHVRNFTEEMTSWHSSSIAMITWMAFYPRNSLADKRDGQWYVTILIRRCRIIYSQYNEAFDLLAFEGAKEKLHKDLGYPIQVLDFKYRSEAKKIFTCDRQMNHINLPFLRVMWIISSCNPSSTHSHLNWKKIITITLSA